MKFSIITIVYNEILCIEETLVSVINQSYTNFEYIVIDGGSNDGTLSVLENYSKSIDILVSEPDKGLYDAMNKGLLHASGDYVIFMNGGDRFASANVLDMVRSKCRVLDKKQLPSVIYGDSIEVLESGLSFYKKARNSKFIWYGMFTHHQAIFYSVDFIRKYNIRYDIKYKIAADYKFTYEFSKRRALYAYINQPICVFSLDGISSTNKDVGIKEADTVRKEMGVSFILRFVVFLFSKGMIFLRNNIAFLYLKLLRNRYDVK